MNRFSLILIVLFSALSTAAAMMKSPDHKDCLGGPKEWAKQQCPPDEKFYVDKHGRCACLAERNVLAPEICAKLRPGMSCGEDMTPTRLYLYPKHPCGAFMRVFAGCGCFGTIGEEQEVSEDR